ncbi:hypothetical protein Z517_00325 [Fonsecaea pedrosoi CBS 271.37]|uniref:HD domain-containing protein n=1 Tax=Fonsecaea pedrosoi CBS 271.37 TaxID=1442368 RepID=A0A0D2FEA3_9EURO|nr:uncharacterized protein Z517_00325 [Fonsecaea pedrosoi CBS 271.37]KIW84937.1 hypothetical protein Z517_00325 [Fonsecaea pedrosoi CBS 271.37]
MSSSKPISFPEFPISQITMPTDDLFNAAYTYVQENCTNATLNHCVRSVAFALILLRKLPPLTANPDIDREAIVLSIMLHDLGWATTQSLISNDKRFEVDGAEIARNFLRTEIAAANGVGPGKKWDKHRLQLIWDAIALHTTPSVAQYKEPEVLATQTAITADFLGPNLPVPVPGGPIITVDEYKEILEVWPRLGFKEELRATLCGLCRTKPQTTVDNFVGQFGAAYGIDGHGGGRAEFLKFLEGNNVVNLLEGGLTALEQYEK